MYNTRKATEETAPKPTLKRASTKYPERQQVRVQGWLRASTRKPKVPFGPQRERSARQNLTTSSRVDLILLPKEHESFNICFGDSHMILLR